MSIHDDWLKNRYDAPSLLSPEQKQIRVARVASIILDKINQLGIETFDGFDEVRVDAANYEIAVWQQKSDGWKYPKISDLGASPMYAEVVTHYVHALKTYREGKSFTSLRMLAVVANMLDDGRMDMFIDSNKEWEAITERRVGYEIVWNMFEDNQ